MAKKMKISVAVMTAAIFAGSLAVMAGLRQWNDNTAKKVKELKENSSAGFYGKVNFSELETLPEPVQRYFKRVLRDGQPYVRRASLSQSGKFLVKESDGGWSRFSADQIFASLHPGFVWSAEIDMAPLISVRIRDSYVKGTGSMKGKLLSLIPVVSEKGKPELNKSSLQRFLAETPWLPTALLPAMGVRWSPVDDLHAQASMTDSGMSVSLEFTFNRKGEITEIYSPGRFREMKGIYVSTPWKGTFGQYREFSGMLVPTRAKAAWLLPDRQLTYFLGEIKDIRYEFF